MKARGKDAETELRDLVGDLVLALTKAPNEVEVVATREGGCVLINVLASTTQLGRLVGQSGMTARALRRIVTVAASNLDVRCELNIGERPAARTAGN